jgi:hypothetical protein
MAMRKNLTRFGAAAMLSILLSVCGIRPVACGEADGNGTASAIPTHGKWVVITPDRIAWRPAKLLPPGAQMAIMEGDPSKPGFFSMRLKMPDRYRIPAHRHSQAERVTVLSGTLYLGLGDGTDPGTALALGAGSYSSMPPEMMHYGWMKGETILQLTSIGPWTVSYLNPADDPRDPGK